MTTIIGITGSRGSGKTTLSAGLVERAQAFGKTTRGFYSPAIFKNGIKTGISVKLLPGGESRQLFHLTKSSDKGERVGKWTLHADTLAWVNDFLHCIPPADVLLFDEIGPLELDEGKGWVKVMDLMRQPGFRVVMVTFRTRYTGYFLERFPGIHVFNLDSSREIEPVYAKMLDALA